MLILGSGLAGLVWHRLFQSVLGLPNLIPAGPRQRLSDSKGDKLEREQPEIEGEKLGLQKTPSGCEDKARDADFGGTH